MTLVGSPAPDFRMPSTKNLDYLNEDVSLGDYTDNDRWLVLFFYPADFTFVCPTEVLAFSQKADEFDACDADVLGVSTDGPHCHQAWIEFALGKLTFPLASDQTLRVSRDYGVLLEDEGIAQRGLFIIDPQGVVRYEVVHDIDTGRNVEEVLRVLKALHTASKCPANWAPGDPTLVVAGPGGAEA
jgi:peroxiredoxin (alkyl hydroperoxide reductase subunit C)